MMRRFWIAFGIGTHLLFAWTVVRLFPFLRGGIVSDATTAGGGAGWLWIDALLAAQFALIHSWLLHPTTRKRLQAWIPSPQYGCVFCAASCASLLLTIEGWQHSPTVLWQFRGAAGTVVSSAFLLSWVALLYSLWLTGLGFQTGWTPWWAWVRGQEIPRRQFQTRGAYRVLRHPVYLSFLGLIWFTPAMTLDRAVLTGFWTLYIFVGSWLKDRRLLHYLGDTYRRYQARVPGYPLLPIGPLGRVPFAGDDLSPVTTPDHASGGSRRPAAAGQGG